MIESLTSLLSRLSEPGDPAILWGRQAEPYQGREFDRALAHGLLTEQEPADAWSVCADCECGLPERPIQRIDGCPIAVCPVDHTRDARLTPEDLRGFRVNAAALVGEIATASGFAPAPSEATPGVWYLGRTPANRGLFLALARDAVLAPGLISALRAAAGALPITLVAPAVSAAEALRFTEAGVHFVPVADAFSDVAFGLDTGKLMPPARIQARLILSRAQSKLVLDGVERELSPISFKLLWLLAEHVVRGDGLVGRRRIEVHLWSTVVSKTAAADAIRNLRVILKTLNKLGGKGTSLIRTITTQGYVLDLAA